MATPVILPQLGNTVETSVLVNWRVKIGDVIEKGQVLCEVETDKATLEVESPVAGTVLDLFFREGDVIPVLVNIAAVGQAGENAADLRPTMATPSAATDSYSSVSSAASPEPSHQIPSLRTSEASDHPRISPRAKRLAEQKKVDVTQVKGSGPNGRIIERDIQTILANQPSMTPVAKRMAETGQYQIPTSGTGTHGKVTKQDLIAAEAPQPSITPVEEIEYETIVIRGARKIIADRMLTSLQTSAQLTLHTSADARSILAYRQRLKNSPEALGLQRITINDLILFVVSRALLVHPELNALFMEDKILQYRHVHLGAAVDTPRGLMVPTLRYANRLSLKTISEEAKRLALACQDGKILPDELQGGTFTVTNLGSLGIEMFTPILNPPQVAILGVGNISPKPIEVDGEFEFVPHLNLSLTINHQIIDGAPGARFLQTLANQIANFDIILAQ